MADLSDNDLDRLAARLFAAGFAPPAAPDAVSVHPAAAEVTPVESLLDSLRIVATPDALAKVNDWLVAQGYEEAPPEPVAEADKVTLDDPEELAAYKAFLESREVPAVEPLPGAEGSTLVPPSEGTGDADGAPLLPAPTL